METGMGREEFELGCENWRRAGVSWCGKGLGWNFLVRECPGAVLGSRSSQIKTQHCWGLLGTVVTVWAGAELGLALSWDRGDGTGVATTSEGIRVFWLFLSHNLGQFLTYCSFSISFMNPTQKICKSFPFLLIQEQDSSLPPLPVAPLKLVLDLTVPGSRAEEPCGCPYVISKYIFFCFKSRKHCVPKTMKVSMSKIKVVRSVIPLILSNGISSFCHLLTFSRSTLQPECSFKIALCVQ